MAFVPAGGAMQVFIHRKNLETHCKLLAEPSPNEGKVGEREPSRPSRE
jgi:hypothetical protein